MYRTMLCAAVLGTALLVSGAATAGPMNVQATLTINLGNLSPVVVNGSGLGSSVAPGGVATLASGALSTNLATPVSPPLIIVNGIGLGASGLTGSPLILNTATPTHPPLVGGMLNWGGATGTMPLNGSA
jgi:hypothetical protein